MLSHCVVGLLTWEHGRLGAPITLADSKFVDWLKKVGGVAGRARELSTHIQMSLHPHFGWPSFWQAMTIWFPQ